MVDRRSRLNRNRFSDCADFQDDRSLDHSLNVNGNVVLAVNGEVREFDVEGIVARCQGHETELAPVVRDARRLSADYGGRADTDRRSGQDALRFVHYGSYERSGEYLGRR